MHIRLSIWCFHFDHRIFELSHQYKAYHTLNPYSWSRVHTSHSYCHNSSRRCLSIHYKFKKMLSLYQNKKWKVMTYPFCKPAYLKLARVQYAIHWLEVIWREPNIPITPFKSNILLFILSAKQPMLKWLVGHGSLD